MLQPFAFRPSIFPGVRNEFPSGGVGVSGGRAAIEADEEEEEEREQEKMRRQRLRSKVVVVVAATGVKGRWWQRRGQRWW